MLLALALIILSSTACGGIATAAVMIRRHEKSLEEFFKNRDPEVPKEISRRAL